eukprot:SAG22_NODE_13780_length_395_cov_0.834459_1_plen_41_part_10
MAVPNAAMPGEYYYWHQATGQTSWDMPVRTASTAAVEAVPA